MPANEKSPGHNARNNDRAGRVRRSRPDRVYDAGGGRVRVQLVVGNRTRNGRDHRLHGDVWPRRSSFTGAGIRGGSHATGFPIRSCHTHRFEPAEHDYLRGRAGWNCDHSASAHRLARKTPSFGKYVFARYSYPPPQVSMDRAEFRPGRSAHGGVCGFGCCATPELE